MLVDKIYLVGFMGAGKTTLATALSTRLGWQTQDIDKLVEIQEGMPVADIFSERGEPYFRAVEHTILSEIVSIRQAVVATGGGTYANPANRLIIDRDGVSIWLDVSLKRVTERLPDDGLRPLANDRSKMERLFHARQAAYRHAQIRVDAEHASAAELSDQIVEWLGP
ncbi:MAG: shikimate kinase [Acidobacteriota bacterium]|nr:shikimate kinase [Acidobacteriota bacterium]